MRRHGLRHWYVIVGLVAFGTMLAVNALLDQMAGLFQGWMNNHIEGLTGAVEAGYRQYCGLDFDGSE